MKAIIFAHRGAVTAISFPGEAMNFNGVAVHEVEAPDDVFTKALNDEVPGGVGSPWPPVDPSASKEPAPGKPKPKGVKPQ